MKSIIFASYQCLLSLALFLLVGMAMASGGVSRVILGEIEASVDLLRVDTLGSHYFEFKNNAEGALYYYGYGKSSPIYSTQVLGDFGIWQELAGENFCTTGTDVVMIKPDESVLFEVAHSGEDIKVGIWVGADPEFKKNSKIIWSVNKALP